MSDVNELRLQPQDLGAEQSTLGSIFIDNDKLDLVREHITEKDFFKYANRVIFKAMITLADRQEPIDAVTMQSLLENQNDLQNIGGLSYLAEIIQSVPTSSNVEYYAKIVAEKASLRSIITRLTESIEKAYDGSEESMLIISEAEKALVDIGDRVSQSGFRHIREVLGENLESLEERSQQTSDITGLATGYIGLDKLTTGLHGGEFIVIAARPAVGKTAFALNIAQNVGTKQGSSVAIFSLEMGAESLVDRMLAAESAIDSNHIRTGRLTDDEWKSLMIAQTNLAKADIYIDATSDIKIMEIKARAKKLKKENGRLDLILIDYLQLITGNRRENRQQEVSEISRQLKIMAKELDVPVIALSQLSRGVTQREDKRPTLSDIRESGAIEQDADIVAFLHRDDYYDRDGDDDKPENNEIEVIVEKNRSGSRGSVNLIFKKEYNKFANISPQEES